MNKDLKGIKKFDKFINEDRKFGIEFSSEIMDSLAWFERVNGFGVDFQERVAEYFIEVKKWNRTKAYMRSESMREAYFIKNTKNSIVNLWQRYLKDQDVRDCILWLLNDGEI